MTFKKGNHFGKKFQKDHKINIGRKRTEEFKEARRNYRHTKKAKQNISKNCGSKRPEVKKKLRESAKNRPLISENTRQKMRENRITNPNKKFSGTQIELKIRAELEKRGFRKNVDYYCNVGLCKTANVDIYLPAYRIVIECDGCYYHNCLIHFPEYHKDAKEADERKTKILTYNGFNVYRFWEHEINKSPEECMNKIIFE